MGIVLGSSLLAPARALVRFPREPDNTRVGASLEVCELEVVVGVVVACVEGGCEKGVGTGEMVDCGG